MEKEQTILAEDSQLPGGADTTPQSFCAKGQNDSSPPGEPLVRSSNDTGRAREEKTTDAAGAQGASLPLRGGAPQGRKGGDAPLVRSNDTGRGREEKTTDAAGADTTPQSFCAKGQNDSSPPGEPMGAQEALQLQKEAVGRIYDHWIAQGEQMKELYPGFDLRAELQNPLFGKLIQSGVDLEAAYVALHKEEIIPAAMALAARAVEQRIAGSLAAGGARPRENGMGEQAPAVEKRQVTNLTKPDIDRVFRQVARGERVSFG